MMHGHQNVKNANHPTVIVYQ